MDPRTALAGATCLVLTLACGGDLFEVPELELEPEAFVVEMNEPVPDAPPRPAEVEQGIRALVGPGGVEGGSDEWDAAVKPLLVTGFDTDGSGAVDTSLEVAAIPCPVWKALDEGVRAQWGSSIRIIYGFADQETLTWVGFALGLDESIRRDADAATEGCGIAAE